MDARTSDPISLPQRRLTDFAIRALEPRGKQYEVRDSEVRGLAIRVNRTSKSWILIGRFGRRHSIRYKLGSYPGMSLKEARAEALRVKSALTAGKDPMVRSLRNEQTFGATSRIISSTAGGAACVGRARSKGTYGGIWRGGGIGPLAPSNGPTSYI
jgi:hypothetical protein